jgi:hypothetical protein
MNSVLNKVLLTSALVVLLGIFTASNVCAAAATYSISGTVKTASGGVITGATVTLSGTATATATVDASGNYTFTGLAPGSYTVTPSNPGYSFTPVSKKVTVNNANIISLNFTGATYSISGTVKTASGAVISGVTVSLSGTATASATVDDSGNYTFTGLAKGSYTVAPINSGYSFTPVSKKVKITNADIIRLNFTGASYSISGTVKTASRAAIPGITITLNGPSTATATTDASGNFALTGLAMGSYTVTPSGGGYTFKPASRRVKITRAAITGQNFTGTTVISGSVTTSDGVAMPGVTMKLSGAKSARTTTDALGNYIFTGLNYGSYKVTPSKQNYTFTPANSTVILSSANGSGQDFTGEETTYSISGTVVTSPYTPIPGVTVTLIGAQALTATTDESGNYTFTGLANGSYTITPNGTGYIFKPVSRQVKIKSANITGQNFTGTTLSISGTVRTLAKASISGVTITLSGAADATTTTNASGAYTFTGLLKGSYTVTPSNTGYTFTPDSRAVEVTDTDIKGQDFAAATFISGSVKTADGTALPGVTVTLFGGGSNVTATTNGSGNYTFTGLAKGSYTITPSLTGYTFTPATRAIRLATVSGTGQDFTGTVTTGSVTRAHSLLGGVAAVGSPIADATVLLKFAGGSALTATTGNDGAWQVSLTEQTLPCAIEVSGGTINNQTNTTRYHSLATGMDTVNVTPLTDLMVANLAGQDPGIWFAGLTGKVLTATVTQASVNTALGNLRTALSGLVPLGTLDPIATTFTATPGDTGDDMLTALASARTLSGISYEELLNFATGASFATSVAPLNAELAAAYADAPAGSAPAASMRVTDSPTGRFTVGRNVTTTPTGKSATDWQMGGARQGTPLNLTATVTTLAGMEGGFGTAVFYNPDGITSDGTNLYVTDDDNTAIRKIVIATGEVTTLVKSFQPDTKFNAITTDGINLYATDYDGGKIRQIGITTGAVTTLAGGSQRGSTDGPANEATFAGPTGITTDGVNLYVADSANDKIRKVVIATGEVSTLAGGDSPSPDRRLVQDDGTAAYIPNPQGITTDGTSLFVTTYDHGILKIETTTGVVTQLAGKVGWGTMDGIGTSAQFDEPTGITTDGTNVYVVENSGNCIRKIVIATGVVTTLAGSGSADIGDGIGKAASFAGPRGITTDGTNLFITDTDNGTIRRVQ